MTTAPNSACPHRPPCSGCPLWDQPYAEQLAGKLRTARETLATRNLSHWHPDQLETIHPSSQPLHYRNRAKLVARAGSDGRLRLGLYQAGTHEVVDVPGCPVQSAALNEAVEVVREVVAGSGLTIYDETRHTGSLRYVALREGQAGQQLLIGLVTRTAVDAEVEAVSRALHERLPNLVGSLGNHNPEVGNVIFGAATRVLVGQDYLEETVLGTRVRLGLTSFFQVNTAVAQRAYERIRAGLELSGGDTLLDLYAGVGSIGLVAATRVASVLAIEENAEAVALGQSAAAAQGLANLTFHAGLVEDLLPQLSLLADAARSAVVVNPPRKGLHRQVIDALVAARPSRLAYLSCNPFTLARDLERLIAGGFALRSVECFDMFPQTEQVETLALLSSPACTPNARSWSKQV